MIEAAFRDGAVPVLCATQTVGAGVNLPCQRVIFESPFIGRKKITTDAYLQMAGRAGRKGLDQFGEVFVLLGSTVGSRKAPQSSVKAAAAAPSGSTSINKTSAPDSRSNHAADGGPFALLPPQPLTEASISGNERALLDVMLAPPTRVTSTLLEGVDLNLLTPSSEIPSAGAVPGAGATLVNTGATSVTSEGSTRQSASQVQDRSVQGAEGCSKQANIADTGSMLRYDVADKLQALFAAGAGRAFLRLLLEGAASGLCGSITEVHRLWKASLAFAQV